MTPERARDDARTGDRDPHDRDPHCGPVPDSAWAADEQARARGRVAIFNATRPGGLDGWTMDAEQYELVRACILETIDAFAGPDGTMRLQDVITAAERRFAGHPLFPSGRMTNKVRYVKTDLEARCDVERVPGSSPQRVRLVRQDAERPDRPEVPPSGHLAAHPNSTTTRPPA